MDVATTAISVMRNGTVPLSELVRAGIGSQPVSIPVSSSRYARLEHVTGIPAARSDEGFSLTRLQALDALIARIRGSQEAAAADIETDPLEQQEELIEELAHAIEQKIVGPNPERILTQGFLLDMTA